MPRPYLFLAVSIAAVSLGDILSKKWAVTDRLGFAVAAVLCYTTGSICWFPLLKAKGLAIATPIWTAAVVVAATVIGLSYGETLTVGKSVGIALAILSVLLLS